MKSRILTFTTLATTIMLVALSTQTSQAAIEAYKTNGGGSAVFEAVGKPSMLRIKGEGAKVVGDLTLNGESATGKFELDLNEFGTGIGLRDRHMKEKYLETAKHPKAILQIDGVEIPKGWTPGTDLADAKFQGQLNIKGVSKPVSGTVNVKGATMATDAKFKFSISDYPIGIPSYMGVKVAEDVAVQVSIPSFIKK